jgi:hypothetical protein
LLLARRIKKPFKSFSNPKIDYLANNLENWNTKILDDELLMYNTLSSVLRFANKTSYLPKLTNSDSLSLLFTTHKN